MVEVVVVDLVAVLCVLHGEVVAGADKEEVPHHVPNHPLVQEPVVNMLPVRVLSLELQTLFNTALRWITKNCTTLPLLKQKKYCTTAIAMLKNCPFLPWQCANNCTSLPWQCAQICTSLPLYCAKYALHCHLQCAKMHFTAMAMCKNALHCHCNVHKFALHCYCIVQKMHFTAMAMSKNALHCHCNVHKFALHCHCIVQKMHLTAIAMCKNALHCHCNVHKFALQYHCNVQKITLAQKKFLFVKTIVCLNTILKTFFNVRSICRTIVYFIPCGIDKYHYNIPR